MSHATRPLKLVAVAACAVVGACGKDAPTQTRVATRLEIVAGSDQTAAIGTALPIKIMVKTSDTQGGVSGVPVAATTESVGGGTTNPTTVTTGANGQAEIIWTLGSKIGTQILTLSSGTIPAVTVSATGQIGAATSIVPVSDAFQLTVVTRAVSILPSVRVTDNFGNPVPGVGVTFDTPVAGSVLTGATTVTNASGTATVGSWNVGPDAINYSVRATITSGPAAGSATVFEARGVPATVVAVAGMAQTANTGTATPQAPAVRAARDDGSPLASVSVTFTVTSGGGSIVVPGAVTGLDGIATAQGWILGALPGANRVDAVVAGVPTVTFAATAVQGVATSLAAGTPATQAGFFGNFMAKPPVVLVTDAQGLPVAGTPVTFELQQADGQLVIPNQVSDAQGHATLGGWRLGSGASQSVRATSGALAPVTFLANATAPPPSTFHLEVRFRTDADGCGQSLGCQAPTSTQRAAFDQAVARWQQIILSGAAPYPVSEESDHDCFPAIHETVDGLVIFASLVPIDGINNILGQSRPCIVRDDHGFQSAVGMMQFDVADLSAIEARGQLNDVILHEMGHVLGFGTMWDFDPGPPLTSPSNPGNSLLVGRGSSDPTFNGPSARSAFLAAVTPGQTFSGSIVPVENMFGPGTRDSHWRESIATTELMTGFISANGVANPLSAFTIGSFRDLGYVVNDAVADPFTLQAALQAAPPGLPSMAAGFVLNESSAPYTIIVVDRRGRTVARVPRK